MNRLPHPSPLVLLLALVLASPTAPAAPVLGDPFQWPEAEAASRPGCIWWWMGSAVDKANITANLEAMHEAGMGGATIVPIYGVKGREDDYITYRTPEWFAMMSHAASEAERLGMWVDMSTTTGWPFGGPMVTDADCDATVQFVNNTLSQKFSGRTVKRAAPGGEGMSLNPYSPEAMTGYLAHFDEGLSTEGLHLPRAQYHDSFEYAGNWSRDLPDEFRKRRDYDLIEHLPALFGAGDGDLVARIKADYRQTLSDLHLEYIQTWVRWSEERGFNTRNQAHGAPGNLLDLYAAAGIPETETFGATPFQIPGIRREEDNIREDMPQPLINRMASSAAHVAGRPLVASESCTWIRNHFRTALSQVKPELDQLFLNGINHVILHGNCYSPADAEWPGWLFYASLEYNPRNTIWHDSRFLNAYVTRCQSVLQSGDPDNDVALFWPVQDIWHDPEGMQQQLTVHHPGWLTDAPCGKAAAWLRDHGYGFDFISDRQLVGGFGASYATVLVPPTRHMDLATLQALLALQDDGTPVIFLESLPQDVPGFHRFAERRTELKALLEGREALRCDQADLPTRLAQTTAAAEPMVEAGLSFIRRTHAEGHHYFVANMSAKAVDEWIGLGVPLQSAVIMDPQSGQAGLATLNGKRQLRLQLLPGETRILRSFRAREVEGPPWPLLEPSGGDPFAITGAWKLEFLSGGPALPPPTTLTTLQSWTESGGEATEHFSGTARYSIDFTLPDSLEGEWILDLGEVRESARVLLNGEFVAALYSIPYRVAVGPFLKPGRNQLALEVTNLAANRIRELDRRGVDWKHFHDIGFVNHRYEKFDASTWPITPSGLLGPVRLLPFKVAE